VAKYVRFEQAGAVAFGILDGDTVRQLAGSPLDGAPPTGATFARADVTLLAPILPSKILAVGRNYHSHVGMPSVPVRPEIFYKPITALQDPEGPVRLPPDSQRVHLEGELVLVIGKTTRNVSVDDARAAIFGVTCGNDISEREWQKADLQWWRAKGADTFAPCGPAIVTGLDPDRLLLTTRLNGEVVQQQSTADLIFSTVTVVSYISRYLTLTPGDLIYTGTPGQTSAITAGDVVEVEIEGVGVLRNPIVAG
jgi:2-keto-4-pentenoate hydratase/2-oxohepta-3-ene-1,7-dioic acid hydratase in catechol pathway